MSTPSFIFFLFRNCGRNTNYRNIWFILKVHLLIFFENYLCYSTSRIIQYNLQFPSYRDDNHWYYINTLKLQEETWIKFILFDHHISIYLYSQNFLCKLICDNLFHINCARLRYCVNFREKYCYYYRWHFFAWWVVDIICVFFCQYL